MRMEVRVGRIRVRTGLVRFKWVKARTVRVSKKHRDIWVHFSELGKFLGFQIGMMELVGWRIEQWAVFDVRMVFMGKPS